MNTFTWLPSYSSRRAHKPQLRVVRFGDGYAQTAQDGINPVIRTYSLTFNHLSDADADAIEAFLSSNVGVTFLWTPPGEATASTWTCLENWERTDSSYNDNALSATFEQQGVYVPKQYGSNPLEIEAEWVNLPEGTHSQTPTVLSISAPAGLALGNYYALLPLPSRGNWQADLDVDFYSTGSSTGAYLMVGSLLGVYCQGSGKIDHNGVCQSFYYGSQMMAPAITPDIIFPLALSNDNAQLLGRYLTPHKFRMRINRNLQTIYLSHNYPDGVFDNLAINATTFNALGGDPSHLVLGFGVWKTHPTSVNINATTYPTEVNYSNVLLTSI